MLGPSATSSACVRASSSLVSCIYSAGGFGARGGGRGGGTNSWLSSCSTKAGATDARFPYATDDVRPMSEPLEPPYESDGERLNEEGGGEEIWGGEYEGIAEEPAPLLDAAAASSASY